LGSEVLALFDRPLTQSPAYFAIGSKLKGHQAGDQDLRDDTRIYLERRAVGCVACGAGWQIIGSTLAALRSIIHTLRGWPTPTGAGIDTSTKVFDKDGRCLDQAGEQQLKILGTAGGGICSRVWIEQLAHLQSEAAE
jgi:FMN reductase